MRSIDIFGPFTGPTGYDNTVRGFVRGLVNNGVFVSLKNFDQWSGFRIQVDPIFEQLNKPFGNAKVNLNFCLPPQANYSEHQFSGIYTMFEATCVNKEWAQMASSFDLVLVPCESSLNAFREGGVRSSILKKVPIGIDTNLYHPHSNVLNVIDDQYQEIVSRYKIRVMNIQELGPRKNIEGILRSWIIATKSGSMKDSSCLILKLSAYSPNRYNKVFALLHQIRNEFGVNKKDHAPIFVSCRMFGDAEMPNYLNCCTHYLSMSRGEGWDLPAIQAAALDKHVIIPRHSSYLDWADRYDVSPAFISAMKKEKAEADGALADIYSKSEWFTPSVDETANILNGLADKPDIYDVQKFGKIIREEYNWENCTKQLIDVLDERVWEHEVGTQRIDLSNSYQSGIRGEHQIPRIITFWTQNLNKPCGIADYTVKIVSAMLNHSKNIGVVGGSIRAHDMMVGMNCYALENIEYEYQFASPLRIAIMLQHLRERGIFSVVTMHTFSENADQHNKSIFKYADKIFVHNQRTLTAIGKSWLPTKNVLVAPMPMPKLITDEEKEKLDYIRIDKNGKFIVGFYGFMYFHKGIEKLVDGFAQFKKKVPEAYLLLVASKPQNSMDDVGGRIASRLKSYGLEGGRDYTWVSDFIANERQAIALLSQSDLIVLPYDNYGSYGASAAVGSVLATGQPTIVSDTVWFDHVPSSVAHKMQAGLDISKALSVEYVFSTNKDHVDKWKKKIVDFVNDNSAEKVAEWHFKQYSSFLGSLP